MKRLKVSGFGPVREADIEFGDLTVLVGPQATGKSLFIQLVKAISDAGAIRADLKQYGYDWHRGANPVGAYSSLYFGGGLQSLITNKTSIFVDSKAHPFSKVVKPGGRTDASESVLVVPAQRVLVLQDEWPKPFMAYRPGDPYCMRRFSEVLRSVMDGFAQSATIFPQPNRLMSTLRTAIDTSIYAGFELRLDPEGQRKRLVLSPGGTAAPFRSTRGPRARESLPRCSSACTGSCPLRRSRAAERLRTRSSKSRRWACIRRRLSVSCCSCSRSWTAAIA